MHKTFTISPVGLRRLFWSLVACELLILFLDIFVNHLQWAPHGAMRRLVNITREDSIGTWFSSTQILLCGVVLLLVHAVSAEQRRTEPRLLAAGWLITGIFFICMGIDDATKFHERIGSTVKHLLGGESGERLPFFPSYTWQLVFGPVFAVMGVYCLWFFRARTAGTPTFRLLAAGLAAYVIAVGLDFAEGLDAGPLPALADTLDLSLSSLRHYSKALEETLEMLGTTFFLVGFLQQLLRLRATIQIRCETS